VLSPVFGHSAPSILLSSLRQLPSLLRFIRVFDRTSVGIARVVTHEYAQLTKSFLLSHALHVRGVLPVVERSQVFGVVYGMLS
jgi:hypothetical protein